MRIMILGATGLVGKEALALALRDSRISSVVAPVRTAIAPHPKLLAPIVDFERLDETAGWWRVDGAVCALGTTRAQAGSAAAFRRIDHDYVLMAARILRDRGVGAFALVSAMGARDTSRLLYSRTKGELETAVRALGFPSLTVLRPGAIGGERSVPRAGERFALRLLTLLQPVLPKTARINPANVIARRLIEAVTSAPAGEHLVTSGELAG